MGIQLQSSNVFEILTTITGVANNSMPQYK